MIVIIFGKRGVGKTALNTFFSLCEMKDRLSYYAVLSTIEMLRQLNFDYCYPPEEYLVNCNYDVIDVYGRKSYDLNPFKMMVPNDVLEYDVYLPGTNFHIMEAQIYFNSKYKVNENTLMFFENSRHGFFNIYLDTQRPKKIDPSIREITDKFITIKSLDFEYDKLGNIIKTIWHCIEFDDYDLVENYIKNKKNTDGAVDTVYEYNGNIFKHYDSHSNLLLFHKNKNDKPRYKLSDDEILNSIAPSGYYVYKKGTVYD